MLQAGATQVDVARRYNVARITIYRLWQRYLTTNTTADRPRSGRPRVTTPRHDRFIRLCHLRNRFETPSHTASVIPGMRRISPRTVRRRLAEAGLRARRPYRGPMLTQRHRQQRLEWSRRHLRWTIRDWQEVLLQTSLDLLYVMLTAASEYIVEVVRGIRTLVSCVTIVLGVEALWCGTELQETVAQNSCSSMEH